MERQRERDRQTDRQKQTNRQTDRQTDRQTEPEPCIVSVVAVQANTCLEHRLAGFDTKASHQTQETRTSNASKGSLETPPASASDSMNNVFHPFTRRTANPLKPADTSRACLSQIENDDRSAIYTPRVTISCHYEQSSKITGRESVCRMTPSLDETQEIPNRRINCVSCVESSA